MSVRIKNLAKLQKRLSTADFVAKPAGIYLREWREDLKTEVIKRAPRWKEGIIRAIQSNQDTSRFPLYARVFSEAPQARWSQYGTGIFSEDPLSPKLRYFPPEERLRDWSVDHNLDPGAVAHGIYTRGGTKPTHFFSDAEKATDLRFQTGLTRFGRAILAEAGKG